ncbi:MAG: hypothetical protein M1825_000070 [Sarcosagium campestre]|nr:MAG: hypothetical protein M1825_000070 [Sarcosagium campestre]
MTLNHTPRDPMTDHMLYLQKQHEPDVVQERNVTNALPDKQIEADFKKLYLRKITSELSDDLDAVRDAPDFSDKSLGVLIEALQQGSNVFSPEEQRLVMEAAATPQ